MGKTNLFKIALGIGGAITALLSRKKSRDKLKQEYNKYKENPESYKSSAKDLATQIGNKANETIQEVKKNPKDYVERIKSNPKEFLEEEKSKIIGKMIRHKMILKKENLMLKAAQLSITI